MPIEGKLEKTEQVHKKYRATRAGKSFEKKKVEDRKKKGLGDGNVEKLNVKAFASGRPGHQKFASRKLDRSQNNMRMPVPDRTFADDGNEAPETVAVVGPAGSGKTTLIRSLVKYLTRTNLTNVRGPVTCVAGKRRRITFIECPCDVHAMCDVAKVADLVLLTVDASFGFEMETFEFLNICQVHGFPKIIGVLTHLDKLKTSKQVKRVKKALRHRFWKDVCAGAKLFYLSGVERGTYSVKEIINLNRFIAVTKVTLQRWRSTHSCVIADRMEDLTDAGVVQRQPHTDRKIALYGYVRGCPMKSGQRVHVPGVGDFSVSELDFLADPCELPQRGRKRATRHLSEKDKRLYAPMADIGELLYDADAVYVKVDKEREAAFEERGEGVDMMRSMLEGADMDKKLRKGNVALFAGGGAVDEGSDDSDDGSDDAELNEPREVITRDETGRVRRRAFFTEVSDEEPDGGDDDDDDDDSSGYDDNAELGAAERAGAASLRTPVDLSGLGEDDDDDLLYRVQGGPTDPLSEDRTRDCRTVLEDDWDVEAVREGIRDLFVTGHWTKEESMGEAPAAKSGDEPYGDAGYESIGSDDEVSAGMNLDGEEEDEEDEEDEEGDGDVAMADAPKSVSLKDLRSSVRDMVPAAFRAAAPEPAAPAADGAESDGGGSGGEDEDSDAAYRKRKEAKKKEFDASHDAGGKDGPRDKLEELKMDMEEQQRRTRAELREATGGNLRERVRLIGHFAGLYVRVVIEGVPCEFTRNFDPRRPIICGGLLPQEDRMGIVYMRMKKHRWFPKLLKSGDPLTLSVGWRRFQTQPIMAIEDANGRNRYLKYTPLHMHCLAAFYGPVTPPNAGIIGFTNSALQKDAPHFRPSATGYTVEVDQSSRVVKKLKLTGVPARVVRNTAFIKNMFTSALEVAKFEGAKIRTVSGIRGTVKKALNGKGGLFRAGFEDKITMSDIVFLKTWKQIEPYRYCNPVTNLLTADWRGMKSTTEIRRERHMKVPFSIDSTYREVQRNRQARPEVQLPRKLQGALPFSEKTMTAPDRVEGRSKLEQAIRAEGRSILEPKEAKRISLLAQLQHTDYKKSQSEAWAERQRSKAHKKVKRKLDEQSRERLKALKKTMSRRADFQSGAAAKRKRTA